MGRDAKGEICAKAACREKDTGSLVFVLISPSSWGRGFLSSGLKGSKVGKEVRANCELLCGL